MKFRTIRYSAVVVSLLYGVMASAQQEASQDATVKVGSSPSQNSSSSAVPRLMKFSGTLLDSQNRPMAGPVGVTFAIYSQESGGAALWMETQNVHPDANGNYTVLLGAASKDGLPTEQFTSGEARWLGLQVENQTERPRVLLVSVPYALKAHDAETLGGLPASAFLPAASPGAAGGAAISPSTTAATGQASSATPLAPCAFNGSGTTNFIPIWTGACSQTNSLLFQTTAGKVGLSTTTPSFKLHVIDSSNAGLRVQTNTAGGLVASFGGNGAFQVDAPGVPGGRFTITSNGLVGLGTNAPGAMLDVITPNVSNDPVAQFGSLVVGSSNSILVHNKFCAASACLPSGLGTGTTTMFLSGGFNTFMPGTVAGDGGLRVTLGRSIFFGDSFNSRMVIRNNGNVGIGTTLPTFALHVNGMVRSETGLSLGGNAPIAVDAPGINGGRFVVLANGNVGIGNPNPAVTLDVAGPIHSAAVSTGPIQIGGDVQMSSAPHMTFSGFFLGSLCGGSNICGGGTGRQLGDFVPDRNIMITRVTLTVGDLIDPSCGPGNANIFAGIPNPFNPAPIVTVVIPGNTSFVDSGPLSAKVSASTHVVLNTRDLGGCNVGASAGGNVFWHVQYVMQ